MSGCSSTMYINCRLKDIGPSVLLVLFATINNVLLINIGARSCLLTSFVLSVGSGLGPGELTEIYANA